MIENLPFKNNLSRINLKEKSYFTILKTQFDQQLEEFTKVIVGFWHYYQLETYNENHNLVFKINQDVFNNLLSYINRWKSTSYLEVFKFLLNTYQSALQNPTPWYVYNTTHGFISNTNFIKNQKSLIVKIKYFRKNQESWSTFGYHSLAYGFWIYPEPNEENSGYDSDGRWFLLQKIEFKVI
ncbi:hypothetical protein [Spiroplasma melliferum]|uniref:hypothetical protein n=1 Tax=Spiroplasma melliferum TaxID=2134 RepID=UPI0002A630A6|nr:hypothetical protein [Spiroplasma melliferum]ELL44834.1 hypothetical protein SMIPMB4A_v3c2040 [Spiroplasma melliferum IPMB4A]